MKWIWLMLVAGMALEAEADSTPIKPAPDKPIVTNSTALRRLTGKELKVAIVYYQDKWIEYRIAELKRVLATDLGESRAYTNKSGEVTKSMRYNLEKLLEETIKTPEKAVTEWTPMALSCTNVVTNKDVIWDDVLKTNTATSVESQ